MLDAENNASWLKAHLLLLVLVLMMELLLMVVAAAMTLLWAPHFLCFSQCGRLAFETRVILKLKS